MFLNLIQILRAVLKQAVQTTTVLHQPQDNVHFSIPKPDAPTGPVVKGVKVITNTSWLLLIFLFKMNSEARDWILFKVQTW